MVKVSKLLQHQGFVLPEINGNQAPQAVDPAQGNQVPDRDNDAILVGQTMRTKLHESFREESTLLDFNKRQKKLTGIKWFLNWVFQGKLYKDLAKEDEIDGKAVKEMSHYVVALEEQLATLKQNTSQTVTVELTGGISLSIEQDTNGKLRGKFSDESNSFEIPLSASQIRSAIFRDMIHRPECYESNTLYYIINKDTNATLDRSTYEEIIAAVSGIGSEKLIELNNHALRNLSRDALCFGTQIDLSALVDQRLLDVSGVKKLFNVYDLGADEAFQYVKGLSADTRSAIENNIRFENIHSQSETQSNEVLSSPADVNKKNYSDTCNFLSDLILNANGEEYDAEINPQTGAIDGHRLKNLFVKHVGFLNKFLNNREYAKSVHDSIPKDQKEISMALTAVMAKIGLWYFPYSADKGSEGLVGGPLTDTYTRYLQENGGNEKIATLLGLLDYCEDKGCFEEMEKDLQKRVDEICDGVSQSIKENLRDLIPDNGVISKNDEVVSEKEGDVQARQLKMHIADLLKLNKELLLAYYNQTVKYTQEPKATRLTQDYEEKIRYLMGLKDGEEDLQKEEAARVLGIALSEICESGEKNLPYVASADEFVDEFIRNKFQAIDGTLLFCTQDVAGGNSFTVLGSLSDIFKGNEQKEYEKRLRDLRITSPELMLPSLPVMNSERNSSGYDSLVINVLLRYFDAKADKSKGDMHGLDRRSMVASYLRNLPNVDHMLPNGDNGDKIKGQMLAGLFKGAGPVMQKALQGVNVSKSGNAVLYEAVKDMKSHLQSIPERYVKAELTKMIAESHLNSDPHARIETITVRKSLGAASVGEALLCDVKMIGDTETKECVLKILRPDAVERARREKEMFEDEAKNLGEGLVATFRGKFSQIMEEFDLRKEADNVLLGRVYDQHLNPGRLSGSDVESMKLLNNDSKFPRAMLVEWVKGDNMANIIEKQGKAIDDWDTKRRMNRNGDDPKQGMELVERQVKEIAVIQAESDRLMKLLDGWVGEALYGSGFYHGDLHAGNVMFNRPSDDDIKNHTPEQIKSLNSTMTVIDFGNAVSLDQSQKSHIARMMFGALKGNGKIFADDFQALLSDPRKFEEKDVPLFDNDQCLIDADGEWVRNEDGRKLKYIGPGHEANTLVFQIMGIGPNASSGIETKKIRDCGKLTTLLTRIVQTGKESDVGTRILVALKKMQKHGIECPGPIFNFANGFMLLSNTSSQLQEQINKLKNNIFRTILSATNKILKTYSDIRVNNPNQLKSAMEQYITNLNELDIRRFKQDGEDFFDVSEENKVLYGIRKDYISTVKKQYDELKKAIDFCRHNGGNSAFIQVANSLTASLPKLIDLVGGTKAAMDLLRQ